jgi:alternate signal-mediated exported protein
VTATIDPLPTRASLAHTPRKRRFGLRTKGVIAILAGTALLFGGGGTYAYWSTQQALTAGTVQSGDLNLSLGAGTWTLKGVLTPTAANVPNPANVRIVPGDVLTLTQPVTVTLVGDTIQANLSVITTTDLVPVNLQQYITVAFTAPGLGAQTGTNTYRVLPANSGTFNATVTITFAQNTPDRVLTATGINLNNVAFSLTQASS